MEILSKFFPIVSVAIAINIAFITIEYIKDSLYQLLDSGMNIDDRIEKFIQNLKNNIENSHNKLKEYETQYQQNKGKIAALNNKIDGISNTLLNEKKRVEEDIKIHIKGVCRMENTLYFNINLLVYNSLWLIFGTIESLTTSWSTSLKAVWLVFGIGFFVVFLCIFWLQNILNQEFFKLKYTIFGYFLLLSISIFFVLCCFNNWEISLDERILKCIFFILSLLSFIHLVIFAYGVHSKSRKVEGFLKLQNTENSSLYISKKYFQIEKEIKELVEDDIYLKEEINLQLDPPNNQHIAT